MKKNLLNNIGKIQIIILKKKRKKLKKTMRKQIKVIMLVKKIMDFL